VSVVFELIDLIWLIWLIWLIYLVRSGLWPIVHTQWYN